MISPVGEGNLEIGCGVAGKSVVSSWSLGPTQCADGRAEPTPTVCPRGRRGWREGEMLGSLLGFACSWHQCCVLHAARTLWIILTERRAVILSVRLLRLVWAGLFGGWKEMSVGLLICSAVRRAHLFCGLLVWFHRQYTVKQKLIRVLICVSCD